MVNDPRIKFFDVPKLGSYFAVPLTYKSCLFDASFDAGVDDAVECRKLRAQQEEEKLKYDNNKDEQEELKEFEEILEKPYKFVEKQLVVALDTLGQDRVFTEEQKEYIINFVGFFKNQWERAENLSLKNDI